MYYVKVYFENKLNQIYPFKDIVEAIKKLSQLSDMYQGQSAYELVMEVGDKIPDPVLP